MGLSVLAMLTGGALAQAPAQVASPERDAIVRSCIQQMFMSQAACGCLADQAAATLDPLQQQWLALGATDVNHSAPISKEMSHQEAMQVDAFMRSVPDSCSARQAAR
jgi:hypothetical protein